MKLVRFRWLGLPSIELRGREIKAETCRGTALLAYLSVGTERCRRELLSSILWPEVSPQRSLGNLRRTLSSLNVRLPGCIEAERSTVALKKDGHVESDVTAFRALIEQVKGHCGAGTPPCEDCRRLLEEALRLHRGDFLEGLILGDSPGFNELQSCQRDALLRHLIQAYAQNSRWNEATDIAVRLTCLDRLDKSARRELMQLYARAGRRSVALREFEELESLLQAEYQGALEEILGRETDSCAGTSPASTASVRIPKTRLYIPVPPASRVVRTPLLTRLGRVQQKPMTLISAPAGFGKTTLLAEWIANTPLATMGCGKRRKQVQRGYQHEIQLLEVDLAWCGVPRHQRRLGHVQCLPARLPGRQVRPWTRNHRRLYGIG